VEFYPEFYIVPIAHDIGKHRGDHPNSKTLSVAVNTLLHADQNAWVMMQEIFEKVGNAPPNCLDARSQLLCEIVIRFTA